MTIQCCVCKKVKADDAWKHRTPEQASDVSHTYCPTCLRLSQAAMREERIRADLAYASNG